MLKKGEKSKLSKVLRIVENKNDTYLHYFEIKKDHQKRRNKRKDQNVFNYSLKCIADFFLYKMLVYLVISFLSL